MDRETEGAPEPGLFSAIRREAGKIEGEFRNEERIHEQHKADKYGFAPKSLTSNEIHTLWRSFDHVQCFTFDRRCVHDLAKLLNCMTPTIFKLLIYQFGDLSNYDPPLITREWLELNTKLCHFDCSSNDYNTAHLWL
ncbi:unnamed protein product [Rotaria magnacalcarata]|uniref:Uncharacterized protein n=2 Tax=Rotaria magnacalcarata TaxID=392030 RepID=A0A816L3T3_9BILA|nr:unnamed protein product [Rotaria magnacalcarata]